MDFLNLCLSRSSSMFFLPPTFLPLNLSLSFHLFLSFLDFLVVHLPLLRLGRRDYLPRQNTSSEKRLEWKEPRMERFRKKGSQLPRTGGSIERTDSFFSFPSVHPGCGIPADRRIFVSSVRSRAIPRWFPVLWTRVPSAAHTLIRVLVRCAWAFRTRSDGLVSWADSGNELVI